MRGPGLTALSTRAWVATAVFAAGGVAICPPSLAVTGHLTTRLAGHGWHYRAQVDGIGRADRITMTGGHDLRTSKVGGTGHFLLRVHLAGSSNLLSSRQRVDYYYSSRKPWTPWYGASDLDRRPGKELLVGFTSGAHTQIYTALTDRGGSLVKLKAPGNGKYSFWGVNSSYGTGSEGWKCTTAGVESRSVYPNSRHTRFHIARDRYVFRAGSWVRTHRVARTVDADASGSPPKYTDHYASFDCPGLPDAF